MKDFIEDFFAMTGAHWGYWLALIIAFLWWQS